MSCQYCEKGADLLQKMIPICTYRNADIYLFRDQTHKGKCIVAYRNHKTEWYELDETERKDFITAVAATAKVVQELFHADKINYATYGDLLSHLHVHVTSWVRTLRVMGPMLFWRCRACHQLGIECGRQCATLGCNGWLQPILPADTHSWRTFW